MLKDNNILLGKANDLEIIMQLNKMNRHGIIAGASGTGKTVTLKVIAESLSKAGVPTFIADIKGDLSGMVLQGQAEKVAGRLESMGIQEFPFEAFPVRFYDIYQEKGHPIRTTVSQMGPLLLSRILNLSEAQTGVLNIAFKIADDKQLELIDIKDLKSMLQFISEHASEYTLEYGNISKQSVGAILRQLLVLQQEGGDLFFGQPDLNINDWLAVEQQKGVMNILHCDRLFLSPTLYSTFLLWMLGELYETLPEVGDLDKPKMVFFFDEAHLLFDDAPKVLMNKIEQIVKLIRSKGVGIFFITQSPADIPNAVLAQCSNRIQHALRAYTPSEIKAVKLAAESFRSNPELDTIETISNMSTGTALVSVLDASGAPTIVQKTKILPPSSYMGMIDDQTRNQVIKQSSLYGKYETTVDNISAYEKITHLKEKIAFEKEKEELAAQREKEVEKARKEKARTSKTSSTTRRRKSALDKTIDTTMNTIGRETGKAIFRGILGMFKK